MRRKSWSRSNSQRCNEHGSYYCKLRATYFLLLRTFCYCSSNLPTSYHTMLTLHEPRDRSRQAGSLAQPEPMVCSKATLSK